jgi:hypothetical protein
VSLASVDHLLDGGTCWGAELDTRYRVLGVTFDPEPGSHPDGPVDDTRLQLVLHPCAEVEARLVRHDGPGAVVESFTVEQLVQVVDRLGGARLRGPVVDVGSGPLGPPLSLEGRSKTADGRRHEVVLVLEGPTRTLTLRVTCDTVEVRRPDGSVLVSVL